MNLVAALALAFLTGLTVAGLSGSMMELVSRTRLSLAPPFLRRERVLLSLCASAAAGPFMLLNDTLSARRDGRIGACMFSFAASICFLWVLATGIVIAELAFALRG